MDYKIELIEQRALEPYMNLLGEIECGDHYSEFNSQHLKWLNNKIQSHISNGTIYYGCHDKEQILGIVGIQIDTKIFTVGTAEVVDIGVIASKRRSGLGSQLLDFAVNIAHQAGVPTIFAKTYAADTNTIAFYGKNAFYSPSR